MPGLGDQNQLEFRGKDAKECEDFINAVSRIALSVGRQRDDNWVADFVASCLAQDALRWWDRLDPSIQKSWNRLRQAMLFKYRPLFHGRSAQEAQTFVRMIRNAAFDREKYDDGRWMAAFASSLFVDEALRWHSSLPYGIRSDWKLLEEAILGRYDPQPAESWSQNSSEPSFRGRVRINCNNFVKHWSCYLSKTLNKDGSISLTSSVDDALEVGFGPAPDGSQSQCLLIPNNQIPGYNMIGIRSWYTQTDSRANFLTLCAVNSISGARSLKTYVKYQGPVLTNVWTIYTPEKTGASQRLTLCTAIGATQLFPESEGVGTKVLFQTIRSMHRAVELQLELTELETISSGIFQYQQPTGYPGALAVIPPIVYPTPPPPPEPTGWNSEQHQPSTDWNQNPGSRGN